MTATPEYAEALNTAEHGGIAGRINSFSGDAAAGAIPASLFAIVGSAFAGSPTMAVFSGVGGVGATVLGGAGYAATAPRAQKNRQQGAEELRRFEPVDPDEDVLDAVEADDIDTVRYTTNSGFRQQDADFLLDEEMIDAEDAYALLERIEEHGDPAYLLREDGYQFTLVALNAPYWNGYSYDRSGSVQGSGNYEVLEVRGDRKDPLGLDTEPVPTEDSVVDAYIEATLA